MDDEAYPLREIVHRDYNQRPGSRPGTGAVMLTLACGHKVHRKLSAEPRHVVRCEDCYFDQRETP